MKIVVLDGYTLNPGDLSWQELEGLGDCTIYDRTPEELVIERSAGVEILLTNKTPVNRRAIGHLQNLRYISVMATGYNIVDVEAATEHGIPVANVPTYGTDSVAQMTFALILELTQHAGYHSQSVHRGNWTGSKDWCFWEFPLRELAGLTIGIIGYGRIGKTVGKIANAFGMNVLVFDPQKSPDDLEEYVTSCELTVLLKESDIITLHCPLTADNSQFINKANIAHIKKSAFLINTSRGQLINERDLADALNHEQLAGAGLDVLSSEPPAADNPLLRAKNTIITPHIAWATQAARKRLMKTVVRNVSSFLQGQPENVVNQ
jgi:glycerate dehydrogenase